MDLSIAFFIDKRAHVLQGGQLHADLPVVERLVGDVESGGGRTIRTVPTAVMAVRNSTVSMPAAISLGFGTGAGAFPFSMTCSLPDMLVPSL